MPTFGTILTELVSELRSAAWLPPLDGLCSGSHHSFHDLPRFRVRREPAQDEGEVGGDHGVEVAVARTRWRRSRVSSFSYLAAFYSPSSDSSAATVKAECRVSG